MASGRKFRRMNSATCENSQPAKFHYFHFSSTLCSSFLAFSALLSFLSLICNTEFDSNSSCLDRLDNFGINSLQKLQN